MVNAGVVVTLCHDAGARMTGSSDLTCAMACPVQFHTFRYLGGSPASPLLVYPVPRWFGPHRISNARTSCAACSKKYRRISACVGIREGKPMPSSGSGVVDTPVTKCDPRDFAPCISDKAQKSC